MEKISFADSLRGVAALVVVISHYCSMFWLDRPVIAQLTGLPALPDTIPTPAIARLGVAPVDIGYGAFGVGLFFLISGFVIPFSLQRYSRRGFLAGRALRILPTYAIGFGLGVAALWLGTARAGIAFPYAASDILAHAVPGLRDALWQPMIDGVVWTLDVELKFYVVCALTAGLLAAGRQRVFVVPLILLASVGATAALGAQLAGLGPLKPLVKPVYKLLLWVAWSAPYLIFMFIGVALNLRRRGLIAPAPLAALVAGLFALFVVTARWNPLEVPLMVVNSYALALAVFLAGFLVPRRWGRLAPLGGLSRISYPLYVIHPLIGYVLMRELVLAGVPGGLATGIAFAVAIGAAWLLHHLVERPTQRLAQQRARALSAEPPLAPAVPALHER